MTWTKRYEETMKGQSAATPWWFECISSNQRDEAQRLADSGMSVCVLAAVAGGTMVLFNEKESTGLFKEQSGDEQPAIVWNQHQAPCQINRKRDHADDSLAGAN